jgi:hypothetical protein
MSQTYLVECYWPGVTEDALATVRATARDDADATWLESILVPEDEIVLCLFEGASVGAVEAAARRWRLPADRVIASRYIRPTADGPVDQSPDRGTRP